PTSPGLRRAGCRQSVPSRPSPLRGGPLRGRGLSRHWRSARHTTCAGWRWRSPPTPSRACRSSMPTPRCVGELARPGKGRTPLLPPPNAHTPSDARGLRSEGGGERMAYQVLSHAADAGIEATAESLPDLFDEVLPATCELMSPIQAGTQADTTRAVERRTEALDEPLGGPLSEVCGISGEGGQ